MTFAGYSETLRTLARIFDVGRQMLWQGSTWVLQPGGRWHMFRHDTKTSQRTRCGRYIEGHRGRYPHDTDGNECRVCTR